MNKSILQNNSHYHHSCHKMEFLYHYQYHQLVKPNSLVAFCQKFNMGKTIFIKEIITILKEPLLCPTCQKEDKLEKDVVREERSSGKTILCSRCEALIVITNHNLRNVELSSFRDDIIMLKEPHLIRKVGY
jgi:hypothetical protein